MHLLVAVHIPRKAHPESYTPGWIEALEKRNVTARQVNLQAPDALEQVRECNGVMWHWFHSPDDKQAALKILPAIELVLDIPVFPSMRTCWHYDEKIAQHYLLQAAAAPRVPTWVFWSYQNALGFVRECTYPKVFKLSVGAGSANVVMLNNLVEAEHLVRKMFLEGMFPYTMNEYDRKPVIKTATDLMALIRRALHGLKYTFRGEYPPLPGYFMPQKDYLYLQEFIPGNPHDIRITIIGNRAFGFIRYNREGDFRASGSGRIDHDPGKIPIDAVKIAHDISLRNNFQSMAYDFLSDREGKMLINEISYCYMSAAVNECPGYWDRDLRWHEGHVRPEDAHVEDFLEAISGR